MPQTQKTLADVTPSGTLMLWGSALPHINKACGQSRQIASLLDRLASLTEEFKSPEELMSCVGTVKGEYRDLVQEMGQFERIISILAYINTIKVE